LAGIKSYTMDQNSKLTVQIRSFSYKRGIPYDDSGHGGGFVFDCRAILNPGRYERYTMLSGKDQEVVDFFRQNTAIDNFLEHAFQLVQMSVGNYIDRDFTHLMISFGCTGGQHRSVYCAEQMAARLRATFDIVVDVGHLDLRH